MYVERLFITSGTSTPPAKQRLPRQPLFGPVKEITSPSFSSTTRHEPTGRPLTEKPRSPPAKTAAPQPQTSSSGPSSVTSSAAAPSGLPSIALPRRSAGRSIAPRYGNAARLEAPAPEVLHRGKHSGTSDFKLGHCASAPFRTGLYVPAATSASIFLYSSSETGTKRTS